MHIKNVVYEDTVNYRKTSMFIGTATCTWKCATETGKPVSMCQNAPLAKAKTIEISDEELIRRYKSNYLTEAIVIGGLEPFDQFDELLAFSDTLNEFQVSDDLVIYTGYQEKEIFYQVLKLINKNVSHRKLIIKYGRYIPDSPSRHDEILGVTLASDNQYAVRYSDGALPM